jgi:hypothetical protein
MDQDEPPQRTSYSQIAGALVGRQWEMDQL